MKSPADLQERFRRQWWIADNREQRLLQIDAWPISLPIGRPTSDQFTHETARVREHLQRWREVSIGRVEWESTRFRSGSEPVDVPVSWRIRTPDEWVAVTADITIRREFARLKRIIESADKRFHRLLIRQLHLTEGKSEGEVLKAAEVATALTRGCANGRSLRAVQVASIDSKFLERNRNLVTQLLDTLFEGEVSELGLEGFLGALDESDHWLLVAPLGPNLLPFAQQRVRASELVTAALPGSHILIVENEKSLYQLPALADAIAILGAGLNLGWMNAPSLQTKRVAYWGDIDTWGLQMLASARSHLPGLTPLLMSRAVFEEYAGTCAVAEESPAAEQPPDSLLPSERELYRAIRSARMGRVEQEFLRSDTVSAAVREWCSSSEV